MVLNTSIVNELKMPGASIYASAKAGLRAVTRILATELAAGTIRVNAVSPGPIASDFFARTGMPEEQARGMAKVILGQCRSGASAPRTRWRWWSPSSSRTTRRSSLGPSR